MDNQPLQPWQIYSGAGYMQCPFDTPVMVPVVHSRPPIAGQPSNLHPIIMARGHTFTPITKPLTRGYTNPSHPGLFLGFWAVTAYCDHFLATSVLCLVRGWLQSNLLQVFGCAGDQLTRYMFTLCSSGGKEEEASSLLDMARQEVTRPGGPSPGQPGAQPHPHGQAREVWQGEAPHSKHHPQALLNEEFKEEDEEEDEEGPPPPVPARKDDIAQRWAGLECRQKGEC